MNWQNYAVIDVETTGMDSRSDRVIEIGVVVLDPKFRILHAWDSLVRPSGPALKPLDPEITRITKITDDMLRTAPEFSWLIPELAQILQDCGTWVGHNVAFDLSFLRSEVSRAEAGGGWPEHPFYVGTHSICTCANSRHLYSGEGGPSSFRLSSVCEHLGIPLPSNQMHSALGDAAVTARLLTCLHRDGFLPPVAMGPCLRLSEEAELQASDALEKQDDDGYRDSASRLSEKIRHQLLTGLGWKLAAKS